MGNRLSIRPIFSALVAIVLILFISSLLLTLLLHFTSVRESSVNWFLIPITLITLFIGGVIAGYKSGNKGWYFGGMTGLAFILLSWLVSFLGLEATLSTKQLLLYGCYLLLAIIGGIIGVNLSPQREYTS